MAELYCLESDNSNVLSVIYVRLLAVKETMGLECFAWVV